MKMLLTLLALALLLSVPQAAFAWEAGCAPEFGNCGSTSDPSQTGSSPVRNGDKSYGAHYTYCQAQGVDRGRCWECVYVGQNVDACGGVRHSASCECIENYSNGVRTSCSEFGTCEYRYL